MTTRTDPVDASSSLLLNSPHSSLDYEQQPSDQLDELVNDFEQDQQKSQQEETAPPKDTANFVLIALFILGLACFFPSTAIFSSNSYYEDLWGPKGKTLVFIAPILMQVSTPLVQLIVTKYQERITFTSRIETAYITNTIVAILFPIQSKLFPNSISFVVAMGLILSVGMCNSVLKATLLSLSAQYPPLYTQVLLLGQAVSPLVVLVVKMSLKYITPISDDSEQNKANNAFFAIVFFMISALFTCLAAVFYKMARRSLFSKHFFPSFKIRYQRYLEIKRLHQEHKDRLALEARAGSDGSSINTLVQHDENQEGDVGMGAGAGQKHDVLERELTGLPIKTRKLDVMWKMFSWGILLLLSNIPPNSCFPSLLNTAKPRGDFAWLSEDWFHLVALALYCVVDILSKTIPFSVLSRFLTFKTIPYFLVFRFIIFALTVVSVYLRSGVSNWITFALVIITSSTNAMTYVAILTQYQSVLGLPVAEKSVAGSISSIFIAFGVLSGYITSLLINTIVTTIWGSPK